jgi:hypothetical protein
MSIGLWLGLIFTVIWGTLADKTGQRGLVAFAGISGLWLSLLGRLRLSSLMKHIANAIDRSVSKMLVHSEYGTARFLALTSAVTFSGVWHPV